MIVPRHMPAPLADATAHRQRGFTLLEIMIVVVIFGILISLATLSIGSISEEDISEHSRRFTTLIELSLEEAGIQNREIGLRFYQHGYEFSMRVADVEDRKSVV